MTSPLRRAAVACAALLALTACGESAVGSPGGADPGGDTLVFASIPQEESTSLQQSYAAVLAMLERQTGTTIEFQNATDYAAVIEGMRAGQPGYQSYGNTAAGSDITDLAGFAGRNVCRPAGEARRERGTSD